MATTYRVIYRLDHENYASRSHRMDVSALDKVDAEGVVKYRHAICGQKIVILKSFRLEDKYIHGRQVIQPRRYPRDV